MFKRAIQPLEYIGDCYALFDALDGLDSNNRWVAKNDATKYFAPRVSSVVPVLDTEGKYLNFKTTTGGMTANFKPIAGKFTIEVVMRDVYNFDHSMSASDGCGAILWTSADWLPTGPKIQQGYKKGDTGTGVTASVYVVSGTGYGNGGLSTSKGNLKDDNALHTITVNDTGVFVDGIRQSTVASHPMAGTSLNANYQLGHRLVSASYGTMKMKVHGLRIYTRCLTDEEILNNFNKDMQYYN